MSDLGDQIQTQVSNIMDIPSGGDWESEYEKFVAAVQEQLNKAEEDSHDHGGENLGASSDPVTTSHVGTANHDVTNSGELSVTDQLNNIRIARQGEVQSKIDDVASSPNRGVVHLIPNTVYDEGAEINLKPTVTLQFNGAKIEPSTDHDVLFIDNSAHVPDGWIDCSNLSTFTSSAVTLDTGRATRGGGKYNGVDGSTYHGFVRGANDAGNGIVLRDLAGAGITLGTSINVYSKYFDAPLLVDTPTGPDFRGWVNGIDLRGWFVGGTDTIRHIGDGVFRSVFRGEIQPTDPDTTHAINHTGDGQSLKLLGKLWDPNRCSESPISGPNIQLLSYNLDPVNDAMATADRATGQMGIDYAPEDGTNALKLFDIGSGQSGRLGFGDNGFETDSLSFTDITDVRVRKSTTQTLTAGDFAVIGWDVEESDALGEFDTSTGQFTPAETGAYDINATILLSGGVADDRLSVYFEDATAGNRVAQNDEVGGSADSSVSINTTEELQGGNAHQIQARSLGSDRTTRVYCALNISRSL